MMLPPIEGDLAALEISFKDYRTDEHFVRFLAEWKDEDPLPQDIIADVDFSVLDPRDFTGSVWHLKWSDDLPRADENSIRKAKNGYWKPVGSSRIPTSTAIVGVKIICEFYEGHAPCGTRTEWMMHEYQVLEQNDEANLPQGYKSLCKVFLQSDENAENGQSSVSVNAPNENFQKYLPYHAITEKQTISATEQDTSFSAVQQGHITQCADDIPVPDNLDLDDYIELNDLLYSEVSASTSENTSKRSMISEDYFDSDAFLKEIMEDSNTPDGQHIDQGLLRNPGDHATVAGPSQQNPVRGGDRDQHSSKERQQCSSSISSCFPSSHVKRSHSNGSDSSQSSTKSQGVRLTTKFGRIGKKYFCFGSF